MESRLKEGVDSLALYLLTILPIVFLRISSSVANTSSKQRLALDLPLAPHKPALRLDAANYLQLGD